MKQELMLFFIVQGVTTFETALKQENARRNMERTLEQVF